jgi:hypothetical protein
MWESKLVKSLWKAIWMSLKKVKTELPYDPVIPLLRISLKKCNPAYDRITCIPMFIVALFTTAKLWKQPRCPTTDGLRKMWYIYNVRFGSGKKRNTEREVAQQYQKFIQEHLKEGTC